MSSKPSFKQAQVEFAAHIRNPEQNPMPDTIEDRRMAIYRDLFISSISSLLSGSFPVMRSLYNDTGWQALVRKYFKPEHNKTPHFPEIPREFVTFLQKQPDTDKDKPFLYELAHYEWLELHLEKHSIEIKTVNDDVTDDDLLNHIPVISPLVRLHSYNYAVHQIKSDFQPTSPLSEPIFMTVWRDTNYQVNFTEMNAFSALLLETLINNINTNGKEILSTLAIKHQYSEPEKFIQFGHQVFQKWLQQDIIISIKK